MDQKATAEATWSAGSEESPVVESGSGAGRARALNRAAVHATAASCGCSCPPCPPSSCDARGACSCSAAAPPPSLLPIAAVASRCRRHATAASARMKPGYVKPAALPAAAAWCSSLPVLPAAMGGPDGLERRTTLTEHARPMSPA